MEHFEHDGGTMAFERHGEGRPAVVLLHNGGTSSTIWRHQVAALRRRTTVAAVDLPGFGCSPRPAEPLDLVGLDELVAAFLVDQQLAPAVLVGNCMGSQIAAGVALGHPELVAALLLVNPLTEATFRSGGLGALHRMAAWSPRLTALTRSGARRVVSPRFATASTLRFQVGPRGAARGVHHDPELAACVTRPDQLPALIDVLDDMRAYRRLDERAGELADAEIPVWTAWGERNRVLSPKAMQRLSDRLSPEREEVVEGCGHLVMLEDPDSITALVEGIFDRVASEAVAS